jgi:hypothetical protein
LGVLFFRGITHGYTENTTWRNGDRYPVANDTGNHQWQASRHAGQRAQANEAARLPCDCLARPMVALNGGRPPQFLQRIDRCTLGETGSGFAFVFSGATAGPFL